MRVCNTYTTDSPVEPILNVAAVFYLYLSIRYFNRKIISIFWQSNRFLSPSFAIIYLFYLLHVQIDGQMDGKKYLVIVERKFNWNNANMAKIAAGEKKWEKDKKIRRKMDEDFSIAIN